ncbi:MAG: EAL domain-containing protein [Proteobacteria bacterium]|nr:EAL domain-containing protein [Pseudomonadota bacterium]
MMQNRDMKEAPVVLVIDDDNAVREISRDLLEESDFVVEEARDGAEGLSVFNRVKPDLVLLDVMMPGMDGFTVCRELRKLPGGERTPVLMATGLDDLESINRSYEAGATDFITKPLNWTILAHRIRYMLRASRTLGELHKSEGKNKALLNAIPDLMFHINSDGTILDFKAAKDFDTVFPISGLSGKKLYELLPEEVVPKAIHYIERALQTGETQIFEYQFHFHDTTYTHEARIVVSGEDEVLAIVRDITEHKRAEEQIIYLAYHDTLTGLPNRHSFKNQLTQALTQAKRYDRPLAALNLGLDRFKQINETLGHTVGDLLLKAVTERLENCVRKSDVIARFSNEHIINTVARLGSDEFIILLTEIEDAQDAAKVAQRILEVFSHPFILDYHEVFITASIGITVYPYDGEDVDTLLKNAGTAMYHAKDQGRNNYQFYNQAMNATSLEKLVLENDLRRALDRQQFLVYYQPQLDLRTGAIIGMEALIRWQHPERGLVQPAAFISLAEETGLIVPIGEWVLRTACVQNKAWQAAGFSPFRVTVNLSSSQFRQETLIRTITQALDEAGMDPRYLELELTESNIMKDAETTITMLHELKSMGLRLSIDDFGTGYSSLSYLKRFPFDTVKVDRSFVKNVTTDSDNAAITTAIIAMAHSLNFEVIAEGVETKRELAFLSKHQCDGMQGYLFSPPVPPEQATQFLKEGKHL